MAKRLAGNPMIDETPREAYAGGTPILSPYELEAPLHLRKPARIGVQFMGDLFHKDVSDKFIAEIWDVMTRCPEHTFSILTKRPDRMDKWAKSWHLLPFINLWLGVSVEDQKTADERIPILLQIPAAKRFVSVEPMLGPVEFTHSEEEGFQHNLLKGFDAEPKVPGIDWVICGGLSLPGGKIQPPKKEWVDSLVQQCDGAGVPIFIKPNAKYPVERKDFPRG
jgi:protein gp37